MFMEMDTVYQCNATSDKDRKIKLERVANLEMEVTNLRGQGMRDNLDLQRIKKEKEQQEEKVSLLEEKYKHQDDLIKVSIEESEQAEKIMKQLELEMTKY